MEHYQDVVSNTSSTISGVQYLNISRGSRAAVARKPAHTNHEIVVAVPTHRTTTQTGR